MPPATHSLKDGALKRHVRVFSALGDETRLALVARLSGGAALSIARLAEGQRQSRQSITKHLRVLTHAGVVRGVRRGRERCFELRPRALDEARESLARISREWDMALRRLKDMLEEESGERGGSRRPAH